MYAEPGFRGHRVRDLRPEIFAFLHRSSENERAEGVLQVARALETHHKFGITASVHPQNAFNVPEWEGMASASAAALLGGAFARK
jgi:hypothetical protein